jgi:hypothetical protein
LLHRHRTDRQHRAALKTACAQVCVLRMTIRAVNVICRHNFPLDRIIFEAE